MFGDFNSTIGKDAEQRGLPCLVSNNEYLYTKGNDIKRLSTLFYMGFLESETRGGREENLLTPTKTFQKYIYVMESM